MNTPVIIQAIPLSLDDEEDYEDIIPHRPVLFYEISAMYYNEDSKYGKGTLIISGAYQYFSSTNIRDLQRIITKSQMKNLFSKN